MSLGCVRMHTHTPQPLYPVPGQDKEKLEGRAQWPPEDPLTGPNGTRQISTSAGRWWLWPAHPALASGASQVEHTLSAWRIQAPR